jgi:hypothetical protein
MLLQEQEIPFTWRRKVSSMRGRKGVLGSMKEGTRIEKLTVGRATTKGPVKGLGATGGRIEASHASLGHGSRKLTGGKGGTHK